MYDILLVEDHLVVRQQLRHLLEQESDFRLVGEAADGLEAVRKVAELNPAVLVSDLAMPALNGLEVLRQIRGVKAPPRVVIVSVHVDEPYVLAALGAGASGYVSKDFSSDHLVAAVRAALEGRRYLSPPISESLLTEGTEHTP